MPGIGAPIGPGNMKYGARPTGGSDPLQQLGNLFSPQPVGNQPPQPAPTGKKPQKGGGWQADSTLPAPPSQLTNKADLNPKLEDIYDQTQAAAAQPNEKMEQLWDQYQGQLSTSNLDQLQDVMGSKIRDRYEGAEKSAIENMARRGVLGSGIEQEQLAKLGDAELKDLIASDTQLALGDQARKDKLILSGQGLAGYQDQRLAQLMGLGMSAAQAQAQLAQEQQALGLSQWQTQLGAQLSRDEFGLQRDLAAQQAQLAQQNFLLQALGQLAPLFAVVFALGSAL